jgi:hypothetical protein
LYGGLNAGDATRFHPEEAFFSTAITQPELLSLQLI